MSEYLVNKNSWMYRWLAWYYANLNLRFSDNMKYSYCGAEYTHFSKYKGTAVEYYEEFVDPPRDFCTLWRHVLLWPAIRFTVNTFIHIAALSVLYGEISSIWAAPIAAFGVIASFTAALALAAVLIIATIVTAGKASDFIKNSSNRPFIGEIYNSYKNKYCKLVRYNKDDTNEKI